MNSVNSVNVIAMIKGKLKLHQYHLVQRGLIRAIRWYQRCISPLFGPQCKYYPSCSHYALTAVRRFGAARGSVLTILRLLRCRPWSRGGIDDVPQRFSIFYRFSWSKAHEEPRLTPLPTEESTDES